MKKYIFPIVVLTVALVISLLPKTYDSWLSRFHDVLLGSISYPSSLDNFVNPGATDSVATVSHSAQHSNANDAIEALEAKVGITSSTAMSGSVLTGNGSGSSIWSTYATTTAWSAITASTTNLTAFGSTTLQDFTYKNATGTSATTTRLAITGLSGQIPYANSSGSILPVTIGTGLSFSGGTLSTAASASSQVASTTRYATGSIAATTTGMLSGQTIFVVVTFCSQNTNSVGLFVKPTSGATSTLQLPIQNSSGGDVAHTLNGTYTAPSDDSGVRVYLSPSTTGNGDFAPGCTGGSNFSILKF